MCPKNLSVSYQLSTPILILYFNCKDTSLQDEFISSFFLIIHTGTLRSDQSWDRSQLSSSPIRLLTLRCQCLSTVTRRTVTSSSSASSTIRPQDSPEPEPSFSSPRRRESDDTLLRYVKSSLINTWLMLGSYWLIKRLDLRHWNHLVNNRFLSYDGW